MGILKIGLKLVGSAALGAAGVASSVVRKAAIASGSDGLADALGSLEDKSFNTIEDMWTPDEKKDEVYYFKQERASMGRTRSAESNAKELKKKYDETKELRDAFKALDEDKHH